MGWGVYVTLGSIVGLVAILEQLQVDDAETLLAEKGVLLPRPRPKVFQYLSDLRTYPQWHPGLTNFEPTDTTPMGIGKHFVATYEIPVWGDTQYDVIVSGYESPRLISFLTDTWMEMRTEIVIEKKQQGSGQTLVTWRAYSRKRSYLFRYIFSPFISFAYSNLARQSVLQLKYALQQH